MIAYLLAVPGAPPAPPACVCMNVDEDSVTGFGGQCFSMKISRVCIITTMLNVFFVLFFLVRERFMIKYLRAHVCACLFGYPPQSGK